MVRKNNSRQFWLCLLAITLIAGSSEARFLTPKQAKKPPRGRIACLPSPTMGTRYMDGTTLGQHHYGFSLLKERDGIIYTCRGGHIDITHLRKVSDWTAFLAYHLREALLQSHTRFTFELLEPSQYYVQIRYPKDWKDLSLEQKQQIAEDASITLAQYLAYMGSVWHEILTWHGFKGAGIYPEYHSAFSWEDNYSNVMGSYIADRALRDPDHSYEEAVTLILDREIQKLGPQSKQTARQAGEAVRDLWFSGSFIFCTMLKRHLDVGFDDGWITPWLIPIESEGQTTEPILYPIPDLSSLEKRGFRIGVEIDPKVWEKKEILSIIYLDPEKSRGRIAPEKHFGPIIEHIRVVANQRYGPHADLYELPSALAAQVQTAHGVRPGDVLAHPGEFSSLSVEDEATFSSNNDSDVTRLNIIRADINGDGKINVLDLTALATSWLTEDKS